MKGAAALDKETCLSIIQDIFSTNEFVKHCGIICIRRLSKEKMFDEESPHRELNAPVRALIYRAVKRLSINLP